MQVISKTYMLLLVAGAAFMLIWGVAGFFEYFTGIVPGIKLQNDAYPSGVQFVHWFLITTAGSVFTFGYFSKWRYTPFAMVILFSNLGVLCTIQTFDFMSDQWGVTPYAAEMIGYLIHSTFLMRSALSKAHFGHNT